MAPGTHFSLVLDVRPGRGIHVYAPGVSGYKPIALAVEPQPRVVVKGAQYPSPEAQAALKDVSSLTLRGTLSYQACDEKICFSPQSVPLTWTIAVRQLDRERAKR